MVPVTTAMARFVALISSNQCLDNDDAGDRCRPRCDWDCEGSRESCLTGDITQAEGNVDPGGDGCAPRSSKPFRG